MAPGSTLCFGPFALDGTDDGLWRGLERCKLTAKAEAVLRYLVAHPGRLVRKADLLVAVWPDVHVSDWVLTTCIHELRYVLGDVARAPQYIATVHRQGYRFIAPVTVVATPPLLSVPAAPPQPSRAAPPADEGSQSTPTAITMEEEHKLVTILCGALAEAPTLAARLGLERWYRLLQTVVNLVEEVLHRYAGTLTLATGDGFTAMFGVPVAQEDHARRAVLAAFELRQRLQDTPALHPQDIEGILRLGMGLHTGLVVVGGLGQAPQRLATAVGAPLHVATRLQQQAAPGTILLSVATYQLVHAEVQATPCGTLATDGQPTPMAVYAVQGLLRRHTGVAGRGPRPLSPFVGRERELALLQDHLAAAVAGQGQVVGLVGEPGMGKTRLLTEFCRSVSGNQVTVYEGRCLSYGQGTPYLPVRDLVRQVCGLVEGAERAEHITAVRLRLYESGITAEDDVALLLHLLDLPVAPEGLARLSPEARQVRTFALLRHLILDAAQRQPLVLVVENLHWSDPTSEAWLASLVERLAAAAVLFLGTYRPGYQPAWGAHTAVTQVALAPLRAPDSRTIIQAVPGAVALLEARVQAMVTQAGGNPFFLEELAWHAVEQGGRDTTGAVPETVHAVLAARLDRLPSEEKRILQTAAIVGTEVPVPLLQAIAERPEVALHRSLAHVQAAEFLYETRLFPEQVYTFKHVLTHEVAYSSLLQARRRALHARIVEALAALSPDRLAGQVDRLAHHAMRGEVWEKAVTYCRQAGVRAVARSAYREAVAYFEQALAALAQLPERRDTLEQAIDLWLALHASLPPLDEQARIFDCLRATEALAERLDDPQRLGQIVGSLCFSYVAIGEYDHAIAAGQRALALATTSGAVDVSILAQTNLGLAYSAVGDFGQTLDLSRRVIGLLTGEWRYARSGHGLLYGVISRGHVAWGLAEMGGFAEGTGVGEEAVQIAEAVEQPYNMAIALMWVGLLYCRQGVLQQAIPVLERGLALCQSAHFPLFLPLIASVLSTAYALAGQAPEALPLLEQLLERVASGGRVFAHELVLTELSAACLLIGRVDEASALAGRLHDLSGTHAGHGYQAHAGRLLGGVAMRRDPPDIDQATAHYRQALALAEEAGMRPLQAHCHLGLGRLYATTGQQEQARVALSTATEMYRAMAMTLWLPQAEAALAQRGEVDRPAGRVP
jgi:class 3 adenylate cyclase/tetratricopeptide (TPR) repeat protein